jgi:hypothetical protein
MLLPLLVLLQQPPQLPQLRPELLVQQLVDLEDLVLLADPVVKETRVDRLQQSILRTRDLLTVAAVEEISGRSGSASG